jgi:hypothetical protein
VSNSLIVLNNSLIIKSQQIFLYFDLNFSVTMYLARFFADKLQNEAHTSEQNAHLTAKIRNKCDYNPNFLVRPKFSKFSSGEFPLDWKELGKNNARKHLPGRWTRIAKNLLRTLNNFFHCPKSANTFVTTSKHARFGSNEFRTSFDKKLGIGDSGGV